MRVKIISWNIWKGTFLTKAIRFLKKEKVDIICLQEVKGESKDNNNDAAKIAAALSFNFIYFEAFTTDRHIPAFSMGNAILSRFEIKKGQRIYLSNLSAYKKSAETEPRIAVIADINAGRKSLTVINTHLAYSENCLSSQARKRQVDKLSGTLRKKNLVLAGDFNAGFNNPDIKKLSQALISADKNDNKPTWSIYKKADKRFSRENLKYKIDHIFVSPDLKVESFEVKRNIFASDHLPVIAAIKI